MNKKNSELCSIIQRAQGNRSQNQFAQQCGISSASITRIISGNYTPSAKTLKKIAKHAYNGVTYEMLLNAAGLYNPLAFNNLNNIYPVDGIISFEVLGSVKAGYDGAFDEIPTGETIELPLSMVSGGQKEDYFVLQVKGDSMHPRLLDGDKILCKRTSSVDSGNLAVVVYNGDEATIKKVNYVYGEDWLELIPFNPEYATKRIEGRDLEQCHVVGKVVKLIRDL